MAVSASIWPARKYAGALMDLEDSVDVCAVDFKLGVIESDGMSRTIEYIIRFVRASEPVIITLISQRGTFHYSMHMTKNNVTFILGQCPIKLRRITEIYS